MKLLFRKISSFIDEKRLVASGDAVLLAVSGGPDSVMLLHFFGAHAPRSGVKVSVAYVHHHMRAEADNEKSFVERLSCLYGFPFMCLDVWVDEKGSSIEEEARNKRYEALHAAAAESGCNRVATGHTLDDQAETVLMHFIKGSGLAGMRGMMPASGLCGDSKILLVRPLLSLKKSDILETLDKNGKEYMVDRHNLSERFFRNRIRTEVLPLLQNHNPRFVESVSKTAFLVQDDYNFLMRFAGNALAGIYSRDKERFDVEAFRRQDIAVRRHITALLSGMIAGSPYKTFDRVEKARMRIEKAGKVITGSELENIIFDRPLRSVPAASKNVPVRIKAPGDLILPDGRRVVISLSESVPESPATGDRFSCRLDAGKTGEILTVGSYKPGESFHPLGMKTDKKLSRFLIDRKIPYRERRQLLLFKAGGETAWVCGVEISEKFKIDGKTEKVMEIKVFPSSSTE